MPSATYAGQTVETDDAGFMTNPEQWNRDVAAAIAAEVSIQELTDQHWQVIEFCRSDAKTKGEPPGVRRIVKNVKSVSMKDMYKLFPKGPGKLAAKVSGLTKPVSCV